MSESVIEISKALSKFQGEVKQPKKDGTNPHFRSTFVTLDGVVAAITDTAPKYGLSFLQFPLNEEDKVGVKTIILHDSGEFIEGDPIFTKPMKSDPQALGAVITYLKRYSLSAIFGITADVDDDAEGAMDRNQQQPQKQQGNPFQNKRSSVPEPNNVPEAANLVMIGGKHAGKTLGDVFRDDAQYAQWMFNNDKIDPNIKKGIKILNQAIAQKGGN